MKINKPVMYLRWILLAVFTLLITMLAHLHIAKSAVRFASIHAMCPFGGLQNLYLLATTGELISKTSAGTVILLGITLLLAVVFRKSFCGLICPFGAIQEFFGKIGKKIFKRQLLIPSYIDKPLRYLKYIILAAGVFLGWKTASLWIAPFDPWAAYAHFTKGLESVWEEYPGGLIILAVTVLASFLYDRFFCKYLCPLGALYGIVGKISPFKVVRNKDACTNCGKCSKACPMNIDVQITDEVKSAECINCQICVFNCPEEGALENRFSTKTLKPIAATVLVMGLFFGPLFALQASGVYKFLPEMPKPGERIGLEEISCGMTINEAATATKTDLKEFYKLFAIPESVPAGTTMNGIRKFAPGYDFEKVKDGVLGSGNKGSHENCPYRSN